MRNIVLARIDDRLIHGQVVTAWVKTTSANRILIADDALMADTFTRRLLKAAAPPGIAVDIYGVNDALGFLLQEGGEKENLILLTKAPQQMETLINSGVAMKTIILGGMGAKPGRSRFNKNISASPEEVKSIRNMVEGGIEILYQLVPSEVPVNVKKFLWEG